MENRHIYMPIHLLLRSLRADKSNQTDVWNYRVRHFSLCPAVLRYLGQIYCIQQRAEMINEP